MRLILFITLVCTLLAACGEEPQAVSTSPGAPGVQGQNDAGSLPATCATGQVEACTCLTPGGSTPTPGTRGCSGGLWLGCSCGELAPVTVQDECLPGRYEGDFSGFYSSGFAGGIPIPVVALDFSGKPGLSFTLLKGGSGGGAEDEFATYTVSNGFVEGNADGTFPFKGKLTGTLDCKTKRFTGELDGTYSILLPLGINEGAFKGPVTGEYDVATHSFTLGEWHVKESEDVVTDFVSEAGGDGDWDAKYIGP